MPTDLEHCLYRLRSAAGMPRTTPLQAARHGHASAPPAWKSDPPIIVCMLRQNSDIEAVFEDFRRFCRMIGALDCWAKRIEHVPPFLRQQDMKRKQAKIAASTVVLVYFLMLDLAALHARERMQGQKRQARAGQLPTRAHVHTGLGTAI